MKLPGSPEAKAGPEDLLALYARIVDELIDQKVVRSSNNPVADYSEYLTARAFGLTLVESDRSESSRSGRTCSKL